VCPRTPESTIARSKCCCIYATALGCCFFALFSKQYAITIPLLVASYDLMLEHRLPRPTWAYVRPYVPFVAVTVLYLGLRYYLFGNAVLENVMAADRLVVALVKTVANQVEILISATLCWRICQRIWSGCSAPSLP
jgi:hypothetical protein